MGMARLEVSTELLRKAARGVAADWPRHCHTAVWYQYEWYSKCQMSHIRRRGILSYPFHFHGQEGKLVSIDHLHKNRPVEKNETPTVGREVRRNILPIPSGENLGRLLERAMSPSK